MSYMSAMYMFSYLGSCYIKEFLNTHLQELLKWLILDAAKSHPRWLPRGPLVKSGWKG